MKTVILDKTQIERILRRIAYQIVEQCFNETEIVLVGIKPRGVWVANQLLDNLKSISELKVSMVTVTAEVPEDFIKIANTVENACLILVDDILNSGTTLMLAASRIVLLNPKRVLTACLVDRKHRKFPIQSDFTGLSLATTIQEHLTLDIENGPMIFLN